MSVSLSDDAISRLKSLLDVISPSMQERNMLRYLADEWSGICPEGKIKSDAMGNLEFSIIKDTNYPTLALIAHTDTICIQITQSLGKGKFRFRSIGTSPHMLLGQPIVVINEDGETFDGVIGFDATSQYGQPKGLVFEDLWIDIPADYNPDSVSTGDLAVLKPRCEINASTISAASLDDRLGLFIIGEVLRRFMTPGNSSAVNLICTGSVQEEVGLRGSAGLDFSHKPDAIIVLDVDHATDIPASHEDQTGRLYLNNGPGIHRKADNSPALRKLIKTVAAQQGLPLQTSLGRFVYGGTDSTSLQVARNRSGNHVCNLTIPCRYIHSPVETASLNDVAAAVEILSGILETMGTKQNSAPDFI